MVEYDNGHPSYDYALPLYSFVVVLWLSHCAPLVWKTSLSFFPPFPSFLPLSVPVSNFCPSIFGLEVESPEVLPAPFFVLVFSLTASPQSATCSCSFSRSTGRAFSGKEGSRSFIPPKDARGGRLVLVPPPSFISPRRVGVERCNLPQSLGSKVDDRFTPEEGSVMVDEFFPLVLSLSCARPSSMRKRARMVLHCFPPGFKALVKRLTPSKRCSRQLSLNVVASFLVSSPEDESCVPLSSLFLVSLS